MSSLTVNHDDNADSSGKPKSAMGYQQTLMYGRYQESLGDYAKAEALRQKMNEKLRKKEKKKRLSELSVSGKERSTCYNRIAKAVTYIWKHTFAKIGEDWVFLAVLGVIMAVVSFAMDYGINVCNRSRLYLFRHLGDHMALQYFAWITLPVFLILFATGFTHVVAPQAIGSGIPEMKTILRGVVLKEYLSGRTFVAKAVGLTCTLGSGMPLGKEGPFVHIASIVASSLSKLVTSFQGIYANESRNSEMLAAACAVGVSCCFAAPVGGVLFSIEVTSVYFAVRNYWRGFFSAVCGAMAFRLLAIWFEQEETITAVFMTGFQMEFPYDPQELFVFAMIGVFCGLGGAMYVYLHRRYVLWMRGNKKLTKFLQRNRFIYPFAICWFISTLSFPPFVGQFQAADIGTHEQIHILFSNYTWSRDPADMTVEEWAHVKHWVTPWTGVFTNLFIFINSTFFLSIIAATLPVPSGVLIPTFKVGAAFGRLVGEAMHVWFPVGVRYGMLTQISPGGYATVGAAAFSGAVTQTISISVIVFEMTGQITHCIPVMVAVLISNAIASLLQPSCYDSIIMIKKLPYLPDILPASSMAYSLFVEDFMVRNVRYIWYGMRYRELRDILKEERKLKGLPLVDNPHHMVLLGSVQRTELIAAIERHIGRDRRIRVAEYRFAEEQMKKKEEENRKYAEEFKKERNRRRIEIARQLAEDLDAEEQLKLKEEEEKKKEEEGMEEAEDEVDMEEKRLRKERRDKRRIEIARQLAEDMEGDMQEKEEEVKYVKHRRPSRFEVTTEDGVTFVPNTTTVVPEGKVMEDFGPDSPAFRALQKFADRPKKSILKPSHSETNAHTVHDFGSLQDKAMGKRSMTMSGGGGGNGGNNNSGTTTPNHNNHHHHTMTGADRWKSAMENIQGLFRQNSRMNLLGAAKGDMPGFRIDMTLAEQKVWEDQEMDKTVNFNDVHIDPAPFQLVEKTSLLKVHSLFSMLGVNHAYVTAIGQLIGVVGLKELRKAIEDANSGQVKRSDSVAPGGDAARAAMAAAASAAKVEKEAKEDDELISKA